MHRLVLIFLFSSISLAHANLEVLEIENMNMSYLSPKGEGKIQRFRFGVDTGRVGQKENLSSDPLPPFLTEIHVENQNGDLVFESAHSYVIWRKAPQFFTNAVKIFSRKLDLYLTYKRTAIKAAIVDYDFIDQRYRLTDLEGACSSQNAGRQIPWRLVENCFNQADLKIGKVNFKTVETNLIQNLVLVTLQELNQPEVLPIDTLSDLKITLKDKQFSASVSFPQVFNLELIFKSQLDWNSNDKILTMDVETVKIGIISVKKIFLDQLAKRSFPFLKVEGEKIIITLNQSEKKS
jgi:hypothetical protein